MADDVTVKFGAQLDGLIAGINDAKDELESITAPIRGIQSAFAGLGEAAAAAFAVDKVVEFSEHYAELGEQIERTSLILGISTDQVQQLSFAIRMGGGDAETAAATIGIFEKNIAEAASGSGTAATAFANMGVSVKNADGSTRSAVDILKDLAGVLSQVSDANIRAEYGRALFGRGYQNLLPILLQGKDSLDALNKVLDETGSKLANDQVKALAESAEKTKELSASWDGLLQELGVSTPWTTAKQNAIDLTQYLTRMAGAVGDAVHSLGELVGLADAKVDTSQLQEFTSEAEKFRLAMQKAKGAGNEVFGPNLPKGITLPSLGKDQTDAGKDEDDAQEEYEKNEYATEIASSHLAFQQIQQDQQGLVDAKKESASEGLQAVQAALELEKDAVMSALDQEAGLYEQDSVEFAQVQNKKALAVQQFALEASRLNTDLEKAQEQASKENEQTFKAATDLISRDMDQMLTGILQGTQTWEQAMEKLFSNLVTSFVEAVLKMMVQWAAFEALTSGFGIAGLVNPLSGGIGGVIGGALGIKSYDVGSWSVPSDQLAFIHQNEMIVPAAQASQIRSGTASLGGGSPSGSASGGQFTINISAIDTQTGMQFLKNNASGLATILAGQSRNFNSNAPGWKS